ncbi:hypothetical protein LIER_09174 [Lithospermum erythrorhizon]|uniref:Homeobox domain-containing protein n=1 Tax=Lithospermum erythrorhizon TaxID=34254 RepID=A0AAV3PEV7_LITER
MELGLTLGNVRQSNSSSSTNTNKNNGNNNLSFCMALGVGFASDNLKNCQENGDHLSEEDGGGDEEQRASLETPLQLNLLPFDPVPRPTPWSSDNASSDNGSSANMVLPGARGLDLRRGPRIGGGGGEEVSSANSVTVLPLMELPGLYRDSPGSGINKRDFEDAGKDTVDAEIAGSRASDDDENGVNARKKLRLTKEQSAFLEESFKEHNTLNPKQKLALVKQLNLRPRQVEVWFQNRRARTKLKQTEVDCEYLKRCCETLTEENRRLHKELQELRALKSSSPFYMQLPATTLTMCPSCERVATTSTAPPTSTTTTITSTGAKTGISDSTLPKAIPVNVSKPRFFPFSPSPSQSHESAAS